MLVAKGGVTAILIIALTLSASGCTRKSNEPRNTVHLASPAKIKGLDPIYTDDLYSEVEVSRPYEGLLQYHYLKRPYVLAPNLAEALPEMSKDGRVYTFRLKKGVLFQDDPCFKDTGGKGRELAADDVVYSFKRLADPKLASSGWWVFDGKIVGLNEWHDEAAKSGAADYSKPVEGLKAIDRYTVRITLKQRSAQFLYSLAMPFTFIVPHEAVDSYGPDLRVHPVGTGPYKLTEFNGASRVVWDRNPTYRKEYYPSDGDPSDKEAGLLVDAGKLLPLNDRVVTEVFEESQPMWLTFLSGKLEVSGIPKDNFAQAITLSKDLSPEMRQKGIKLHKAPQLDITHISFNMDDPVVGGNKYLRQALSLAYDETGFIDLFYNGRAIPAQGPIPPGLAGYDPNFRNPYREFNLAKAKELLAKAGYPGGKGLPPLEYLTLSDSTERQMLEYAEKMFGAIGAHLRATAVSWPEFQDALKRRKGQMWDFAWSADYPDSENFLQLFYGKNVSPGPNDSGYHNPEFDKLYEKSLTMVDSPERTALYRQMTRMVVEDCPWILNSHRLIFTLVQPWLRNYKPHDFDHGRAKYYRIDPSLKK